MSGENVTDTTSDHPIPTQSSSVHRGCQCSMWSTCPSRVSESPDRDGCCYRGTTSLELVMGSAIVEPPPWNSWWVLRSRNHLPGTRDGFRHHVRNHLPGTHFGFRHHETTSPWSSMLFRDQMVTFPDRWSGMYASHTSMVEQLVAMWIRAIKSWNLVVFPGTTWRGWNFNDIQARYCSVSDEQRYCSSFILTPNCKLNPNSVNVEVQ